MNTHTFPCSHTRVHIPSCAYTPTCMHTPPHAHTCAYLTRVHALPCLGVLSRGTTRITRHKEVPNLHVTLGPGHNQHGEGSQPHKHGGSVYIPNPPGPSRLWGDSSQSGLQSTVHMLPSLSPNITPVTPTAVCLGPTQPSYTGKIHRHYLQGTMGTGRQVRGLTFPKDTSPCSPHKQELPPHHPPATWGHSGSSPGCSEPDGTCRGIAK